MSFWVFNNMGEFFPHSIHNKDDELCLSFLIICSELLFFHSRARLQYNKHAVTYLKPILQSMIVVSLWN